VTAARQVLGPITCNGCGSRRAEAADRDAWVVVVHLGALALVLCPTCKRMPR
jgi:hypothetical protein